MLRRSFVRTLCLALAVSVMLPGFATAAPNVRANYLVVTAPATARMGEEFTVKVTGKADGKPVEGASVYLASRYEPLALDSGKAGKTAARTSLGLTDKEGNLKVTLTTAGNYFIEAEKQDYSQGFSAITVRGLIAEITFTVDKPVYLHKQTVTMTLANGLSTAITLASGAPWSVDRPNGEKVYSPAATQAIVEVKAGESKTWTWDQKDKDGAQVKPGAYILTLTTSKGTSVAKFSVAGLRTDKDTRNPDPKMPATRPFRDVTGDQPWGDPHVLALYQKGIVKGKGADNFDPEGTLTRAEFVTMVLRACGLEPVPTEGKDVFQDVTASHWAWANIAKAVELGIVKVEEYPNGFGPDVPVTRMEICVMATRALGLDGEAGQKAGEALGFEDSEEVELSYRGYIMSAVDWGILKGYEDNTFRPAKNATRREAAVIVYRLTDLQ